MTETQLTEAEGAVKIAAKPEQFEIVRTPVLLLPPDWERETFEECLDRPTRKKGTTHLTDADSFVAVCKRQGDGDSAIYLDVDYSKQQFTATAIFNDHGYLPTDAGWRDHRAVFEPQKTEEWARWNAQNAKAMEQTALAHFLEENIADIAPGENLPSGSDVLNFVSALEETRTVKFKSAANLQNGLMQLEFVEDGDDATKGKLELFKRFAIGLPPYLNGPCYRLDALLRYRIDRNTGAIKFWYELQRPDRVIQDATREIVEQIKAGAGLPVYFGSVA